MLASDTAKCREAGLEGFSLAVDVFGEGADTYPALQLYKAVAFFVAAVGDAEKCDAYLALMEAASQLMPPDPGF